MAEFYRSGGRTSSRTSRADRKVTAAELQCWSKVAGIGHLVDAVRHHRSPYDLHVVSPLAIDAPPAGRAS